MNKYKQYRKMMKKINNAIAGYYGETGNNGYCKYCKLRYIDAEGNPYCAHYHDVYAFPCANSMFLKMRSKR